MPAHYLFGTERSMADWLILRHFPTLMYLDVFLSVPQTFHSNYKFLVFILKIQTIQNFNFSYIFKNEEPSTYNNTGMS